MSEISREEAIIKNLEELEAYRKLGSVEQLSKKVNEEDILKFYYCESENKYYVGKRLGTMYYAEVMMYPDGTVCLSYQKSRYLPWGESVYPSEPKEISFQEWLQGFNDKAISDMQKLEKIEKAIPDIEHLEKLMVKMFEEWDCFREHSYFEKLGISIFSEGMQTVGYILDCLRD